MAKKLKVRKTFMKTIENIIYRRDTCRACNSKDLELVLSLKPTPIGDAYVTSEQLHVFQPSYPIDLHLCSHCGLAQIIDVIEPAVLYGNYIYMTESSVGLQTHFSSYVNEVIERCNLKSGEFCRRYW